MSNNIKIIFLIISFVSIFVSLFGQKNVVVCSIAGSLNVTSSGSATYTIPIHVVPGTANMQPNLAIFYNSQSNAGILGMRWHLSGLSSINRVSQNAYIDNNITGINLDNNDRYAIDGNRLIAINGGGYGHDGTLYATEIETFTRIKSFGNIQGIPQSFEAQTDDGKIIEYGTTTDSRQMLGSNVLSWMIHKITDSEGNFMIYTYEQSNGEIWVKEINYTGNTSAGLLPYSKVAFEYESDNMHNTAFIGGESLLQSKLLIGIKIYYNNNIVRQYNFMYHKIKW